MDRGGYWQIQNLFPTGVVAEREPAEGEHKRYVQLETGYNPAILPVEILERLGSAGLMATDISGPRDVASSNAPALQLLSTLGGGTAPDGGGRDRYTLLFEDMAYDTY